MYTLSLKVPDIIKEKLSTYAKKNGRSQSDIIRSALLEYFSRDDLHTQGTFFDLAKDLAGSVKGPSDLSTNKDYLDGYGK